MVQSGRTVSLVAKYRPPMPIMVRLLVCLRELAAAQLVWGLFAAWLPPPARPCRVTSLQDLANVWHASFDSWQAARRGGCAFPRAPNSSSDLMPAGRGGAQTQVVVCSENCLLMQHAPSLLPHSYPHLQAVVVPKLKSSKLGWQLEGACCARSALWLWAAAPVAGISAQPSCMPRRGSCGTIATLPFHPKASRPCCTMAKCVWSLPPLQLYTGKYLARQTCCASRLHQSLKVTRACNLHLPCRRQVPGATDVRAARRGAHAGCSHVGGIR